MGYAVKNVWGQGVLRYRWGASITAQHLDYFSRAMEIWRRANVEFVEAAPPGPVVTLDSSDRNASESVGQGTYSVFLNTDWSSVGHGVHELGHALGLHHEQYRPDGLYFNTIDNSPKSGTSGGSSRDAGPLEDCTTHSPAGTSVLVLGRYDYCSAMHYDHRWSGFPLVAMGPSRWPPGSRWRGNNHPELSADDKWSILQLYGRVDGLTVLGVPKPYHGNDTRSVYADTIDGIRPDEGVHRILVWATDDRITGYQFTYQDGQGIQRDSRLQSQLSGEPTNFDLAPGEFLEEVSGGFDNRVRWLRLKSNRQEILVGKPKASDFTFRAPGGLEIVGFAGHRTQDEKELATLGAVVRPRAASQPPFALGSTAAFGPAFGSADAMTFDRPIRRFGLWTDQAGVHGIFVCTSAPAACHRFGGLRGLYSEFTLTPTEHICGIHGTAWHHINDLSFTIRDGVSGALRYTPRFGGGTDGEPFNHEVPAGYGLLGLRVFADNSSDLGHGRLYALGADFGAV
ncbi:MAG: jacalin-like lectin [Acidobacteriota bacterium]